MLKLGVWRYTWFWSALSTMIVVTGTPVVIEQIRVADRHVMQPHVGTAVAVIR
jgi:hypothetical protein